MPSGTVPRSRAARRVAGSDDHRPFDLGVQFTPPLGVRSGLQVAGDHGDLALAVGVERGVFHHGRGRGLGDRWNQSVVLAGKAVGVASAAGRH